MTLPGWLPLESWAGWCEMRKQMRRVPFTERAKQIALKELEDWHSQGYDVGYILDEATLKGWRGLFINERTPRTMPERKSVEWQPSEHVLNIRKKIDDAQRQAKERREQEWLEIQRKCTGGVGD